ncbi:hypothetical protein JCM31185_04150 [Furfurilactobacillus curtus]|uniref:Uncharacterized protein n=1 Tax=Furfurilactobacillus curtus TaxID=1746200 RepID=A0ABQ5JPV0_9LACO
MGLAQLMATRLMGTSKKLTPTPRSKLDYKRVKDAAASLTLCALKKMVWYTYAHDTMKQIGMGVRLCLKEETRTMCSA